MSDIEDTAEVLYHFITGYRYHGPLVHDPVRPEVAKKRLLQLVEKYGICLVDAQALLAQEKKESHVKKKISLHDRLLALSIYGDYECAGINDQCTHPASIRHPMSGKFYCSGHVVQFPYRGGKLVMCALCGERRQL